MSCIGRCDTAPAAAVNELPGARPTRSDALDHRGAGRSDGGEPAPQLGGAAPWPNDPVRAGAGALWRTARAAAGDLDAEPGHRHAAGRRTARDGRRRLPDRARNGSWSPRRPRTPKYVICNADESEPGTFKDRQILAEQPHLVLEGLLLGMAAVGAEEGWVFIRHEYGPEEAVIRREIESLRAAGLVGEDVLPGAARRAVGRGVHLARRLHPRRGVGAASSAWRATAANRATSRRSLASTACGDSRR